MRATVTLTSPAPFPNFLSLTERDLIDCAGTATVLSSAAGLPHSVPGTTSSWLDALLNHSHPASD